MKFLDILRTANSNLWRNKLRSILTIAAIFIGSFTIILNVAINTGVNSFIDRQIESVGGEEYIEMAPKALFAQVQGMMIGGSSGPQEYDPDENASALSYIDDETLAKVEEIEGIKPGSVRPVRSVDIEYISSNETDKKFVIRAYTLHSNSINIDLTDGVMPNNDTSDYEMTIGPGFATALGFADDKDAVGQDVVLAVKDRMTGALSNITARVVGTQAASVVSMGRSWMNVALIDAIFDVMNANVPAELANLTMFVTAEFYPSANLDDIKDELSDLGLAGMTLDDSIGMVKAFFDVVLVVFSIFGGIALLAASIGIINTLFMSVQERTREIGLMKAMGLPSSQVFLLFSLEAIMLGLYGSIIGITLSMIVGLAGNAIAHGEGMFLSEFPTFNLVEFTPVNLLIITATICFIAFLAGTLPARRAAKKDPIDALRYE
jgi:putative ABC transport system permease protein